MKTQPPILLGYEVPSGAAVEIPSHGHLCITGMTQQSGKTTTLDALITRSGRRAVTFITKRGESAFENARRIKPYFRERADWRFVEAIIEATMRQKMRFERGWIMRATRGASTLRDVSRNIEVAMKTAKGLSADIYLQLHAYLEIVLPQIERLDYAHKVEIGSGLNVMDLSAYSAEMQALVIRSVLEWVHEKEDGVIVVIPEAWETLPEGRGSPVKLACEQIFRKGAGIGNLIWLDSQDIAGVWKEALRACSVWIMGVQSEIHEVKRMLAHLPTPNSLKPKPEQVMVLKRGQFYVRFGAELKLVYVQPVWMLPEEAICLAQGVKPYPHSRMPDELTVREQAHREGRLREDVMPVKAKEDLNVDAEKERQYLDTIKRLETRIEDLQRQLRGEKSAPEPAVAPSNGNAEVVTIKLDHDKPEIEVSVKRRIIQMNDQNNPGRLALLLAQGYFDKPRRNQDVIQEFRDRSWAASKGPVPLGPEISKLAEMGFVRKTGESTYQAVSEMKVRIVES